MYAIVSASWSISYSSLSWWLRMYMTESIIACRPAASPSATSFCSCTLFLATAAASSVIDFETVDGIAFSKAFSSRIDAMIGATSSTAATSSASPTTPFASETTL